MVVLFLGVLMGALDIAIVGPALPAIRTHFGVDDRATAWIFTIYVLFNLIGAPLMAKLSDRYGRRVIYLIDIGLFAVGSLAVALAPSFGFLLVARALQGLSAGGIFPVASAVIGDTWPEESQGSALGLIGAVFGLAFIIGPILGGVLLLWTWQLLFLVNLPVALVIILIGANTLPTTRSASLPRFDLAGLLVLSVLLGGLIFGINQLDTTHWVESLTSNRVWPYLAVAVLCVPIFVYIERRAVDPIFQIDLLRSRQLSLTNVLSAGAGIGEAAIVFLPALAIAAFGVSNSMASFLILPVVLAMSIGSPLAGRLLDKIGPKPVISVGTIVLAAGMFLLGVMGSVFWAFIVAGSVIGLGLSSLLGAPVRYIVLREAPVEQRAAAQGMLTIFTGIGQVVSGALVGAVVASQGGGVDGYTFAYVVVGLVTVAMVLLSMGLKPVKKLGVDDITSQKVEERSTGVAA
jgi:EmrB/QacA subfamily drug resistance transporter